MLGSNTRLWAILLRDVFADSVRYVSLCHCGDANMLLGARCVHVRTHMPDLYPHAHTHMHTQHGFLSTHPLVQTQLSPLIL